MVQNLRDMNLMGWSASFRSLTVSAAPFSLVECTEAVEDIVSLEGELDFEMEIVSYQTASRAKILILYVSFDSETIMDGNARENPYLEDGG